jgi:hypothetical protein
MKLRGFEDIDPSVRAFILITIAIAYPVWDFGFELGAFAYPDLLKITQCKPKIAIAAIVVSLALAGFLVGRNHSHFLTCKDFELSGNFVPPNCAQPLSRY